MLKVFGGWLRVINAWGGGHRLTTTTTPWGTKKAIAKEKGKQTRKAKNEEERKKKALSTAHDPLMNSRHGLNILQPDST